MIKRIVKNKIAEGIFRTATILAAIGFIGTIGAYESGWFGMSQAIIQCTTCVWAMRFCHKMAERYCQAIRFYERQRQKREKSLSLN